MSCCRARAGAGPRGRRTRSSAPHSARVFRKGQAGCSRCVSFGFPTSGEVKAAFLDLVVLPPPATGPLVFALRGRARAWRAADRRVAGFVQAVVRNVVGADVIPHLRLRPRTHERALTNSAGARM